MRFLHAAVIVLVAALLCAAWLPSALLVGACAASAWLTWRARWAIADVGWRLLARTTPADVAAVVALGAAAAVALAG